MIFIYFHIVFSWFFMVSMGRHTRLELRFWLLGSSFRPRPGPRSFDRLETRFLHVFRMVNGLKRPQNGLNMGLKWLKMAIRSRVFERRRWWVTMRWPLAIAMLCQGLAEPLPYHSIDMPPEINQLAKMWQLTGPTTWKCL